MNGADPLRQVLFGLVEWAKGLMPGVVRKQIHGKIPKMKIVLGRQIRKIF